MEPTAYEECLDLMAFYEVYCSPQDGVVQGNIGGWVVIACAVAIALIVITISKGENNETYQPPDEFDLFR